MFKCTEIGEQVYKGVNTSKNTNRVESDRASHGRKLEGVGSAFLTNPKKVRARELRKNHADHPINGPNSAKKCLFLGPEDSLKD